MNQYRNNRAVQEHLPSCPIHAQCSYFTSLTQCDLNQTVKPTSPVVCVAVPKVQRTSLHFASLFLWYLDQYIASSAVIILAYEDGALGPIDNVTEGRDPAVGIRLGSHQHSIVSLGGVRRASDFAARADSKGEGVAGVERSKEGPPQMDPPDHQCRPRQLLVGACF